MAFIVNRHGVHIAAPRRAASKGSQMQRASTESSIRTITTESHGDAGVHFGVLGTEGIGHIDKSKFLGR